MNDDRARNSDRAHAAAEAQFKKKDVHGPKALTESEADRLAVDEKTARLRSLRLAREADAGKN